MNMISHLNSLFFPALPLLKMSLPAPAQIPVKRGGGGLHALVLQKEHRNFLSVFMVSVLYTTKTTAGH